MSYTRKKASLSEQEKLSALVAAGMKRSQVARLLGVSYRTVHRWLDEGVTPHPRAAREIDALFKENVDLSPVLETLRRRFKNRLRLIQRDAALQKKLFTELTYHSNAIEGSRMSRRETAMAVQGQNVRGKELFEILEAVNHQNALKFLLTNIHPRFRIDEDFVLKLHGIVLYNFHSKLPGRYRTGYVNLTNTEVPTPSAQLVPVKMKELIKKINHPGKSPLPALAIHHHEFETIHPFFDGNGRVGRLILLAQALIQGYAPPLIRIDDQKTYYTALAKADIGEFQSLKHLLQEAVVRGYEWLE